MEGFYNISQIEDIKKDRQINDSLLSNKALHMDAIKLGTSELTR